MTDAEAAAPASAEARPRFGVVATGAFRTYAVEHDERHNGDRPSLCTDERLSTCRHAGDPPPLKAPDAAASGHP